MLIGRKYKQGNQTKDDGMEKGRIRRHWPDTERARWARHTEKRYRHMAECK